MVPARFSVSDNACSQQLTIGNPHIRSAGALAVCEAVTFLMAARH